MKSWNWTGVCWKYWKKTHNLQKSGVVRNIIGERHSIFKTQPLFVGQNSCRSSQEQRGSAELLLYVLWVWAQRGFLLSSLDSFASVGEQGFLSGSECAVHSKRLLLCWKIYPAPTNRGKTTNSAENRSQYQTFNTLPALERWAWNTALMKSLCVCQDEQTRSAQTSCFVNVLVISADHNKTLKDGAETSRHSGFPTDSVTLGSSQEERTQLGSGQGRWNRAHSMQCT